jgi:hypothetical protein
MRIKCLLRHSVIPVIVFLHLHQHHRGVLHYLWQRRCQRDTRKRRRSNGRLFSQLAGLWHVPFPPLPVLYTAH